MRIERNPIMYRHKHDVFLHCVIILMIADFLPAASVECGSTRFVGYLERSTTIFAEGADRWNEVTIYGEITVRLNKYGSPDDHEARMTDGTQEWVVRNGLGEELTRWTEHPALGCTVPLTLIGRTMEGSTPCVNEPIMFSGDLDEEGNTITGVISVRHTYYPGFIIDKEVVLERLCDDSKQLITGGHPKGTCGGPINRCQCNETVHAIVADSCERLELKWECDPNHQLVWRYSRPGGVQNQKIGACHYPCGYNQSHFTAPDEDRNGIPDYFVRALWTSYDLFDQNFGSSKTDGKLDAYRFVSNMCENKFGSIHIQLVYACGPPAGECTAEGVTPKCDPPWKKLTKKASENDPPVIVKLPLGPETESYFNSLAVGLNDLSPDQIIMTMIDNPICDIDWDKDCDLNDLIVLKDNLGGCYGENNYDFNADIDGDLCLSEDDFYLTHKLIWKDVDGDEVVNFIDLMILSSRWLNTNCDESNNWCDMADIDISGNVDLLDLTLLSERWP